MECMRSAQPFRDWTVQSDLGRTSLGRPSTLYGDAARARSP